MPASSDIQTMDDLVAKLKADPGRGLLGRRLGRRRRPHPAGLIAKAVGRRSDQGQLHRLLRRRRGAGGDPRRPGHGRRLRLRRVREPDRGRAAAAARGLRRGADRGRRRADAEARPASTWRWRTGAWSRRRPASPTSRRRRSPPTSRSSPPPRPGSRSSRPAAGTTAILAGDDFEKQLAADIEATSAILTDIGLVQ